jgi:hypothetical protein
MGCKELNERVNIVLKDRCFLMKLGGSINWEEIRRTPELAIDSGIRILTCQLWFSQQNKSQVYWLRKRINGGNRMRNKYSRELERFNGVPRNPSFLIVRKRIETSKVHGIS